MYSYIIIKGINQISKCSFVLEFYQKVRKMFPEKKIVLQVVDKVPVGENEAIKYPGKGLS